MTHEPGELEALARPLVGRVARAISDRPFRAWQSLYDYCLRQGDHEETARHYADATHKPDCDKVLEQAHAAVAIVVEACAEVAVDESFTTRSTAWWAAGHAIAKSLRALTDRKP